MEPVPRGSEVQVPFMETLGSERFRRNGTGSERFRSSGSIHETLGSERFRSPGSNHETLGSERFRSQGSVHENGLDIISNLYENNTVCLFFEIRYVFAYNMFCVSHSMFSVTRYMSKRKTVPVHQLLGFSHGLIIIFFFNGG